MSGRGNAIYFLSTFGGGMLIFGLLGTSEDDPLPLAAVVGLILFGAALLALALYVFFGNSPRLKEWDAKALLQEQRVAAELREAERKKEERRSQGLRGRLLGYAEQGNAAASGSDRATVSAAQVNAVSNPETAQALQELQKLLYTRAISDEEFQAAKDTLLRSEAARAQDDAFDQLLKLVELHEAGILSDVEFAAAKLRVLGLA